MNIADDLREALTITRQALRAQSVEDATRAVQLRAPALERAADAKREGNGWGALEDQLAHELMLLDLQLIQTLWNANADAMGNKLSSEALSIIEEQPELNKSNL